MTEFSKAQQQKVAAATDEIHAGLRKVSEVYEEAFGNDMYTAYVVGFARFNDDGEFHGMSPMGFAFTKDVAAMWAQTLGEDGAFVEVPQPESLTHHFGNEQGEYVPLDTTTDGSDSEQEA